MKTSFFILLLTVFGFNLFANDECANAITLTPQANCVNTSGSFSGMTISGSAPTCATPSSQDVWYKFTATDETMRITLGATEDLYHGFEIIQGACGNTPMNCTNQSSEGWSEDYWGTNFIPGQLYFVRVFNTSPTTSSLGFTICVRSYSPPANNECANAIDIIPGTSCPSTTGTFSGATLNGPNPVCSGSASQDVWYKFTATDSTHSISVAASGNTSLNPSFQIFENSCSGTQFLCENESTLTSEYYFDNNFIPGTTYYVRVLNASSSLVSLDFTICIVKFPVPANNLCANAIELTPATTCTNTLGTFSGAMLNGPSPACPGSASQDVWYQFTATSTTMSINVVGVGTTNLDAAIQIYEGGCNGTLLICDNSSTINSENYAGTNFVVGTIYFVRILNAESSIVPYNFNICIVGPAPSPCTPTISISSNQGTSICSGQQVIYSATITDGGTSPAYQWKRNGANVGTGLVTYTSSVNNNGDIITCELTSNAACANPTNVASNSLTMNVGPTVVPTITISSNQGTTICTGQQVIYSATTTNGGSSPVYQWKRNGTNVGTGLATYTSSANNNGDVISCELTSNDPCSNPTSAVSNSLTMNVNPIVLPTISISSNQGTSICSGQQVIYSATIANGGPSPVYQWKRNGTNVGTGLATYTSSVNNNGDVITCQLTSSSPCASESEVMSNSLTMNVSVPVTPTFIEVEPICEGSTFSLPTNSTNGIVGTWSPALNNSETTMYTFIPTSGLCASNATITVTVNEVNTNVSVVGTIITAQATGLGYQWINCSDDSEIPGANSNAFSPTQNGDYGVIITDGDCVDTSVCVTINSLAIDTMSKDQIGIYPNPFDQSFTINGSVGYIGKLYTITDALGKTVATGIISSEKHQISELNNKIQGVYFLTMDVTIVKLIKKN